MTLKSPLIELMGTDEIKDRVARIILAGTHWLILPDAAGADHLCHLEESFYSGPENQDFDIMIGPVGDSMMSIAFASKEHLDAETLSAWLNAKRDGYKPVTPETLKEKDIIFLARPFEGQVIAAAFHNWISPTLKRMEKENSEREA